MSTSTWIDDCQPGSWREQFGCPKGWRGWIIGWLMAFKNGERSAWVRGLLDPQPDEHILEIGFGPGVDLARVSERAAFVAGVDRSALMVRQAAARNRRQVAEGRLRLECGSAEALPFPDGSFDQAYAINSAQFWKPAAIAEIRRVLKAGGRLLAAVQPRSKGATEQTATETAARLTASFAAAGFQEIVTLRKAMRPVSTVCVSARL